MKPLTFKRLRQANIKRCKKYFPGHLEKWTPAEWGCAIAGEVGEALNLIKKLHRGDTTTYEKGKLVPLDKETVGREFADAIAYIDLCAASMKIDLDKVTRIKFNEVSKRVGSKIKL